MNAINLEYKYQKSGKTDKYIFSFIIHIIFNIEINIDILLDIFGYSILNSKILNIEAYDKFNIYVICKDMNKFKSLSAVLESN